MKSIFDKSNWGTIEEQRANLTATLTTLMPNTSDRNALLKQVNAALKAIDGVFATIDNNPALKAEVEEWKGFGDLYEGRSRWLSQINNRLVDSMAATAGK